MNRSNIACCYFPTTVVFIDDNRSFLDNVLLGLDRTIKTCSFTDPTEALEYLQNHALTSFSKKYLKSLKNREDLDEFGSDNVEHGYLDVDVFNIHKEIYNPKRFDTVIVVIIDYTMPEMNGVEFCKALKGFPFKFILMTGDATVDIAVQAFNEGLIHQFIPKSLNGFIDKLQTIVYDFQSQQFEEFSDIIIKSLSADHSIALNDPILINFIRDIFKQNSVVEYYLINESGCFLLVDFNGNLSCLVIKSEDEMVEYTNIAIDNGSKEKIIQELQSREKVLFVCTEEEHISITVDDWEKYLYPAIKVVGKSNTYYYAHVKKIVNDNVFKGKIVSYKKILTGK